MSKWNSVPQEIKDELATLGLSIGGTIGNGDTVSTVLTSSFPQKGNKKLIELLELQGWKKDIGRMIDGSKYINYKKEIEEYKNYTVKENKDGNCPYCNHSCEDEYIGVHARLINEKYYDTVKCSSCGKPFDRVYDMILIKSQSTKSTNEILKGDK